MTSLQLYEELIPKYSNRINAHVLMTGINYNFSTFFTKLIKDAARCNRFSSDVIYDIEGLRELFGRYSSGDNPEPVWIGFRKDGVDGTRYIESKLTQAEDNIDILGDEYFVLYCVKIEPDEPGWCYITINEYWM